MASKMQAGKFHRLLLVTRVRGLQKTRTLELQVHSPSTPSDIFVGFLLCDERRKPGREVKRVQASAFPFVVSILVAEAADDFGEEFLTGLERSVERRIVKHQDVAVGLTFGPGRQGDTFSDMTETVILSGARTPIGKMSGALASFSGTDLGGFAIEEALKRAGVAGEDVDFAYMGQVVQGGAGQVPARQAALKGHSTHRAVDSDQ